MSVVWYLIAFQICLCVLALYQIGRGMRIGWILLAVNAVLIAFNYSVNLGRVQW